MDFKSFIKTAGRIIISLGLIFYLLIYKIDFAQVMDALKSFEPIYFIIALVLIFCGTFVSSLRWQAILQTSEVKLSNWYLFALYLKGYFYNNFLPTQMGGDVYKSISVGRKINDQSTALFSVFMDRFSGLIVLLVIGLFGIGSIFGWVGILGSLLILVLGLALYFPVLNFASSKIKFLVKFKKASEMFVQNKKIAVIVLGYSILVQLFSFSMIYVLFLGVGIILPIWSIFAYLPIASLSLLIPSFNGFGTQDAVYTFLFVSVGVTAAISILVSLLIHITRILLSLVGGLAILLSKEL